MSLSDLKFKESEFTGKKISDLSDTPSADGMSAQTLKAYFDYIPKTLIALGRINSIIEYLELSGANDIGAIVSGMAGTDVQTLLEEFKTLSDDRYTKSAADSLLALKSNKSVTDGHIKNVTYNSTNGTFTFTKENGETLVFDTDLEKVVTNFEYDSANQRLILTYPDGRQVPISLADFITNLELRGSDTINVAVDGQIVTLSVKAGSITESMLGGNVLETLRGYANDAATYADNASGSAQSAYNSANSASGSASRASTSETNASTSASKAASSATVSGSKALVSEGYALGTQNGTPVSSESPYYQNNSKYFCDKAGSIAVGVSSVNGKTGTVTLNTDDISEGTTNKYVTITEKATWNAKADADDVPTKVSDLTNDSGYSTKANSFTVTLSGWSNNACTVNDERFIATGYAYTVTPSPSSFSDWSEAIIYADDVTTSGQMTFHCDNAPSGTVTANILRSEANE